MPGSTYTDISCSAAILSIRQHATLQNWLHAACQMLLEATLFSTNPQKFAVQTSQHEQSQSMSSGQRRLHYLAACQHKS